MAATRKLAFLDRAILNDRLQQLRYMFRDNCSLNGLRTQDGLSPLVLALKINDDRARRRMFNFLLSRGADITEKDGKYKRDVLMWACYYGRVDQVSKLLSHAPGEFDLRDPDVDGMLPVHYAIRSGNPLCVFHVVKEMRKYGIPVDIPDSNGLTPLLEAKRLGYEMIAQILIKEGGACPTQFDTKRFRTKTRWSETGEAERENEYRRKALEEIRIVGSFRPHTSYQKRREISSSWRMSTTSTDTSDHFSPWSRPKTSPVHLETLHSKEMYTDLEIRDLKAIVDGKASVKGIRRMRGSDRSEEQVKNHDFPNDWYGLNRRQHGRVHVWPKLNLLMSLSEKAASLPTDAFASSVPSETNQAKAKQDGKNETPANKTTVQSSHNAMLTSMLTSLSQQMSSAYRKTIIPKPMPIIQPTSPNRRKKKDSTLAFILKTTSGAGRTSRTLTRQKSTRALSQMSKKSTKSEVKQPTTYRKRLGGEAVSHDSKQSQLARLRVR